MERHLARNQVVGIWESDEAARTIIERTFGAGALAEAEKRFKSIQAAMTRRDEASAQVNPPPNAAASRKSRKQARSAEADRSLALEISPTGGIHKIFHQYPAALATLAASREQNVAIIAQFRQANSSLEQRLRAKFSRRVKQIDAIYQSTDLAP